MPTHPKNLSITIGVKPRLGQKNLGVLRDDVAGPPIDWFEAAIQETVNAIVERQTPDPHRMNRPRAGVKICAYTVYACSIIEIEQILHLPVKFVTPIQEIY